MLQHIQLDLLYNSHDTSVCSRYGRTYAGSIEDLYNDYRRTKPRYIAARDTRVNNLRMETQDKHLERKQENTTGERVLIENMSCGEQS